VSRNLPKSSSNLPNRRENFNLKKAQNYKFGLKKARLTTLFVGLSMLFLRHVPFSSSKFDWLPSIIQP